MSESFAIAVFARDKAVASYLEEIVRAAGLSLGTPPEAAAALVIGADIPLPFPGNILWLGTADRAPAGVRVLEPPVRAARLIEILQKMAAVRVAMPEKITLKGGILDTRDYLWSGLGGETARLTEKETAILVYLAELKGKSADRETLLTHIWSYADSVETHTLETHIYRLRQKIEPDPSRPASLLTVGDGYAVAMPDL